MTPEHDKIISMNPTGKARIIYKTRDGILKGSISPPK